MTLDYAPPKRTGCELREWADENGWGYCGGGMDKHHILSKSLLRGNSRAKALAENDYGDFLFADVCNNHNAQTKCADLPEARAYLLRKRCKEHGEDVMRAILDDIRGEYKSASDRKALSLDVLVGR